MIAFAASAIIGFLAISVLIGILLGRWFRMQDRIHNRELAVPPCGRPWSAHPTVNGAPYCEKATCPGRLEVTP